MSKVMLTLNAKALNSNEKIASRRFKIDQKLVENRSRLRVPFEVASRLASELILDRFRLDFGPILAPRWPRFCCGEPPWSSVGAVPVDTASLFSSFLSMLVLTCRLKPPRKRFQIDLGPILAPFWNPKSVPNGSSQRHANER